MPATLEKSIKDIYLDFTLIFNNILHDQPLNIEH